MRGSVFALTWEMGWQKRLQLEVQGCKWLVRAIHVLSFNWSLRCQERREFGASRGMRLLRASLVLTLNREMGWQKRFEFQGRSGPGNGAEATGVWGLLGENCSQGQLLFDLQAMREQRRGPSAAFF